MNLFNFFKKKEASSTSLPIDIYNLEISASSSPITKQDLCLLNFFLNFFPSEQNLCCCIQTFQDNVFANIYCQTYLNEWKHLNKDMIEVTKLLSVHDYPEDFLNLLDISDDDYSNYFNEKSITTKTIDFINNNKRAFQTKCTSEDKIYVDKNSDVNYFKIVWGRPNYMNFMSEDWG